MIQLYAITDRPGPPEARTAPLRVVAKGELAAVCGPIPEGEVTAETLWSHERVVEALMNGGDLLPVRYGTRLPDAEAAARALEANHDQLLRSLDFVRGAVELSVHVLTADSQHESSARTAKSGVEYLRARAADLSVETDVARTVHERLSALARAQAVRPRSSGELLRSAYLVDRPCVQTFSDAVQEVQAANRSWRITCTGPWPPYSFTEQ